MGNTCACFNTSSNNPQSKLISDALKKGSINLRVDAELSQFPKKDSVPMILNKARALRTSRMGSVMPANSDRESMRKDSRESFHETEYMSFDTAQMSMLRRNSVKKLSQRLSAAGNSSRMISFRDRSENASPSLPRKSLSQVAKQFFGLHLTLIAGIFRIVFIFRRMNSQMG